MVIPCKMLRSIFPPVVFCLGRLSSQYENPMNYFQCGSLVTTVILKILIGHSINHMITLSNVYLKFQLCLLVKANINFNNLTFRPDNVLICVFYAFLR